MSTRTRSFFENLVLVAILLVLVQTFLEDLAVVLDWTASSRLVLMILGFVFDLFFTVEFIVRSYDAWRYRRFGAYFWYERGWIDFLASVPLLLLNSGPAMLALAAGGVSVIGIGGMLNILKVVKAIRIARVLRLLRVLKIFRRIKNTESVMAQRHVAMISATAVSIFVVALMIATIIGAFFSAPSMDEEYQLHAYRLLTYLSNRSDALSGDEIEDIMALEESVLLLRDGNRVLYSRYPNAYFQDYFGTGDYGYLEVDGVGVFIDLRPINRDQSASNLRYFFLIIAMILVYMFVYSPHFAMTVSDPIHIMRRGLSEQQYNLEVLIPPQYGTDDVYELAKLYNEVFLPMKDRSGEETEVTSLKMDDLKDIFG